MPSIEDIQKEQFYKELLNKMARYCAYQERASGEVLKKLDSFHVSEDIKSEIFNKLKQEGFIDDNRYAEAFTNGKIRSNQWGRIKIRKSLSEKGISSDIIEPVLRQIDENEYTSIMVRLIKNKLKQIKDKDVFIRKNKVARYLTAKGFEGYLIWQELGEIE